MLFNRRRPTKVQYNHLILFCIVFALVGNKTKARALCHKQHRSQQFVSCAHFPLEHFSFNDTLIMFLCLYKWMTLVSICHIWIITIIINEQLGAFNWNNYFMHAHFILTSKYLLLVFNIWIGKWQWYWVNMQTLLLNFFILFYFLVIIASLPKKVGKLT